MPTSNTEELGRFLKCTVIGRGVFGPCACCLSVKYIGNSFIRNSFIVDGIRTYISGMFIDLSFCHNE